MCAYRQRGGCARFLAVVRVALGSRFAAIGSCVGEWWVDVSRTVGDVVGSRAGGTGSVIPSFVFTYSCYFFLATLVQFGFESLEHVIHEGTDDRDAYDPRER